MKPNNFPFIAPVANTELYTQTNDIVGKFTMNSAKEFITAPTDVTYSELYNKIINEELIPGSWYRLTDYKSVNFLNGWQIAAENPTPTDPNFNPQEIYEGEVEVLILQATSPYEIAEIGYSETFQGDIVQYEPFTNKIGINFEVANGNTLPDSNTVSGFDLKWDGTNVYFDMPTGYPALYGHYFYLYAEFQDNSATGPIGSFEPNISGSGNFTGLGGSYNMISPSTLTGIGSGLILDVSIKSGVIYFGITNYGDDYAVGDTLLILGSLIGGVDGVNDATITVLNVDAPSFTYYQDGTFEPLTPNISICQFPYSFDGGRYTMAVSRIKLKSNGMKVVLLDLVEADYNNYITDTLYVDTIYALGDAYGWITRRIDTFRNINVPFDFRGRKYRRFEVDLSSVNSSLGTGYYGIGDKFSTNPFGSGPATTGSYQDFKVFDNENQYASNIEWQSIGGADAYGTRGINDNNVFFGQFASTKIENLFSNNTIAESFYNVIRGPFLQNVIGNNFFNNTIKFLFVNNTIGTHFQNNTIGDYFTNNTVRSYFQYNTIKAEVNSIDFSSATHVGGIYNCEIFRRSDNTLQLSYIDGTNTVQYSAINA